MEHWNLNQIHIIPGVTLHNLPGMMTLDPGTIPSLPGSPSRAPRGNNQAGINNPSTTSLVPRIIRNPRCRNCQYCQNPSRRLKISFSHTPGAETAKNAKTLPDHSRTKSRIPVIRVQDQQAEFGFRIGDHRGPRSKPHPAKDPRISDRHSSGSPETHFA